MRSCEAQVIDDSRCEESNRIDRNRKTAYTTSYNPYTNDYKNDPPQKVKNLQVCLPIGKSLPNEFRTKVGCLAFRVFSQRPEDKLSVIFREEPSGFWILRQH